VKRNLDENVGRGAGKGNFLLGKKEKERCKEKIKKEGAEGLEKGKMRLRHLNNKTKEGEPIGETAWYRSKDAMQVLKRVGAKPGGLMGGHRCFRQTV